MTRSIRAHRSAGTRTSRQYWTLLGHTPQSLASAASDPAALIALLMPVSSTMDPQHKILGQKASTQFDGGDNIKRLVCQGMTLEQARRIDMVKALGRRMQEVLTERHLSQAEGARLLGVSQQRLNNWIVGVAAPDIYYLSRFATVFNISLEWLIHERVPGIPASGVARLAKGAAENSVAGSGG